MLPAILCDDLPPRSKSAESPSPSASNGSNTSKFILYLEPAATSSFKSVLNETSQAVVCEHGADSTHCYPPHVSLTSFFSCPPHLVAALKDEVLNYMMEKLEDLQQWEEGYPDCWTDGCSTAPSSYCKSPLMRAKSVGFGNRLRAGSDSFLIPTTPSMASCAFTPKLSPVSDTSEATTVPCSDDSYSGPLPPLTPLSPDRLRGGRCLSNTHIELGREGTDEALPHEASMSGMLVHYSSHPILPSCVGVGGFSPLHPFVPWDYSSTSGHPPRLQKLPVKVNKALATHDGYAILPIESRWVKDLVDDWADRVQRRTSRAIRIRTKRANHISLACKRDTDTLHQILKLYERVHEYAIGCDWDIVLYELVSSSTCFVREGQHQFKEVARLRWIATS
ncbi:unnamed protein product [Vitrella brassicaformis CCMP3155]|uniref:Uncharacterized protein n=2 Tax=Vitrella brassicaformis TaxID=1169539 RepID=A0A0G4F387_VITBC|nr:unnamed protein product [Vitrella brassicaformis CCMP3155]|eukprot:CEM06386.1 unnamed protein product [Vitrella brassicaformis CCMP3155]